MLGKNESIADRIIRLVVGLILLALAIWLVTGWLQIVLYILAIIALITAATGWCLVYKLCGCGTMKKDAAAPAAPAPEHAEHQHEEESVTESEEPLMDEKVTPEAPAETPVEETPAEPEEKKE